MSRTCSRNNMPLCAFACDIFNCDYYVINDAHMQWSHLLKTTRSENYALNEYFPGLGSWTYNSLLSAQQRGCSHQQSAALRFYLLRITVTFLQVWAVWLLFGCRSIFSSMLPWAKWLCIKWKIWWWQRCAGDLEHVTIKTQLSCLWPQTDHLLHIDEFWSSVSVQRYLAFFSCSARFIILKPCASLRSFFVQELYIYLNYIYIVLEMMASCSSLKLCISVCMWFLNATAFIKDRD